VKGRPVYTFADRLMRIWANGYDPYPKLTPTRKK
jgi:hypothetical protein